MSLVAYDNSDESGDEIEKSVSLPETSIQTEDVHESGSRVSEPAEDKGHLMETVHPKLRNTLPKPKNSDLPLVAEELTKRLLFSSVSLPKSRSSVSVSVNENKKTEESVNTESYKNSALTTAGKKPVKITLPSLSEFNDDEETKPKKIKPSTKGSGLFSLLPAPKNLVVKETNRKLIPRVVSKESKTPKHLIPAKKTGVKDSTSLINYPDSGDESGGEDNSDIDFFSLTAPIPEPKPSFAPTTVSGSLGEESFLHLSSGASSLVDLPLAFDEGTSSSSLPISSNQGPPGEVFGPLPAEVPDAAVNENELQLDDDAIQRLCGRRGRQEITESQIIDVCGETHLPDPKEWLTKQLTEEQETRSHSHRRRDGPTTQQRRKHQITYLAFQAKENELELKNQWAHNRMSRKQTQAKYGF